MAKKVEAAPTEEKPCMYFFWLTKGSYSLKLICFGIVLPAHAHQELTLRVDKECLSDSLLFLIRALICLRSSLVNLL